MGVMSLFGCWIVRVLVVVRFKKCLSAGMKVSWVLSDEERNRYTHLNELTCKFDVS